MFSTRTTLGLLGLLATAVHQGLAASVQDRNRRSTFSYDLQVLVPESEAFTNTYIPEDISSDFTRDSSGNVFCVIANNGLAKMSEDMLTWTIVGTDSRLGDATHTLLAFEHNGGSFIALAQPDHERLLIVDTSDWSVVQEITAPPGSFTTGPNHADANTYFLGAGAFKPTGIAYNSDTLYLSNGLAAPSGDYIVTLTFDSMINLWEWGTVAWGGDGTADGECKECHGLMWLDQMLFVCNKMSHRIDAYDSTGTHKGKVQGHPANAQISKIAVIPGTNTDKLLATVAEVENAPPEEKYPTYVFHRSTTTHDYLRSPFTTPPMPFTCMNPVTTTTTTTGAPQSPWPCFPENGMYDAIAHRDSNDKLFIIKHEKNPATFSVHKQV